MSIHIRSDVQMITNPDSVAAKNYLNRRRNLHLQDSKQNTLKPSFKQRQLEDALCNGKYTSTYTMRPDCQTSSNFLTLVDYPPGIPRPHHCLCILKLRKYTLLVEQQAQSIRSWDWRIYTRSSSCHGYRGNSKLLENQNASDVQTKDHAAGPSRATNAIREYIRRSLLGNPPNNSSWIVDWKVNETVGAFWDDFPSSGLEVYRPRPLN